MNRSEKQAEEQIKRSIRFDVLPGESPVYPVIAEKEARDPGKLLSKILIYRCEETKENFSLGYFVQLCASDLGEEIRIDKRMEERMKEADVLSVEKSDSASYLNREIFLHARNLAQFPKKIRFLFLIFDLPEITGLVGEDDNGKFAIFY